MATENNVEFKPPHADKVWEEHLRKLKVASDKNAVLAEPIKKEPLPLLYAKSPKTSRIPADQIEKVEIHPVMPPNPKQKYGDAKPQLALCPHAGMVEQAKAHMLGADKYGPFNWRRSKIEAMTYAHAIIRHVEDWIDGKDKDDESGAHPLGHIMASCAIVIDADALGMLIDNRPRPSDAEPPPKEQTGIKFLE